MNNKFIFMIDKICPSKIIFKKTIMAFSEGTSCLQKIICFISIDYSSKKKS